MTRVEEVEADFLPLVYEIVRSLEREVHETSSAQKAVQREPQDSSHQKMLLLKEKLDKCREQVNRLPGIDCTKEEQLKRVEGLSRQLLMKRDLLQRYKNSCPIDAVPKMI